MKDIKEFINKNDILNESASNSLTTYYEKVIEDICYLIENAPYCGYTLNSSDMEWAAKDILDSLHAVNTALNERALYYGQKIEPADIKKESRLKVLVSKAIIEALSNSLGNDYTENSEDYEE